MPRRIEGDWHPGVIPDNVAVENGAMVESSVSFGRFRSTLPLGAVIREGASIYAGTMLDVGPRGMIRIGRCALLNAALIQCDTLVEIGDYCLVSWSVAIMDSCRAPSDIPGRRAMLRAAAAHPDRWIESAQPARPVRIGPDVWVGFGCCILPGVTIGEGSIVGARSVVIEDVPACTIVGGNPARVLREIDPGERAHARDAK
jgi:acetyltransferase-like isoleucine patch superfamily enzyme